MNISERDPGFLVVDSCVDSNGVFVSLDVDGRVLSGLDFDVTAHVADASHMLAWNATPNDDEIPLEGHFQSLSTGFLISSSDGAWRIGSDWKAVEVDLGVEGNSVRRVSSSVDGKILIGGYDGRCRIFSSNLLFIEEYLGNLADSSEFEFITSVCFSPDGTCVLSASEGGVHLWSVGDSTISTIINSSCRIGCFCGSGDVLVENLNVWPSRCL
ncbi:MAG: hypothetical protein IPN71_10030 [Fibrobacteres bacterium]|nr:hypothetical protein [Fibrobacterota bacterium]